MKITIDIVDKQPGMSFKYRAVAEPADTPNVKKMGDALMVKISKTIPALKDTKGSSANMRVSRFLRGAVADPELRKRLWKEWKKG